MIDELLSEYTALETELQKRRQQLSETLRPKFHEAFAPFFERHPKLDAVTFTAYTPYFNDGDECIYGVNEAELVACGLEDIEAYSANAITNAAAFNTTGLIPANVQEGFDKWGHRNYESPEAFLRATAGRYLDFDADTLRELGAITGEYSAIQEVVSSVPDEVIKGMFGDHMKVTISREGVEAEEYDHD